ncbi:hypothetical protein LW139_15570 [Proteus vulgaris]|uniref:hypothetical protein n=1 Tax=Proteus TaxID=583 RepID=UPI001412D7D1|nr:MULTISPECIES: hypothetical protein [Proteus]NBM55459.1 hypothetical protein [Proteus sp. G2669]UDN35151.1 hypothetical protein LG402_15575 [Proteus sp. NMG38-2]UPK80217.1 hypothetical protein LW139_15570 [Proteus vulgaris]
MKEIIDNRELKTLPLVERTIYLDDNIASIEFSIIGDLDFNIEFKKKYKNKKEAIKSIETFIKKSDLDKEKGIDFIYETQMKKSKLLILNSVINNTLSLPDHGDGYLYLGDIEYIKELTKKLRTRLL